MKSTKHIAVVGGGAAGMMAAGTALRAGASVTVYEHKERPLRKVMITGKGRCNLTNDCSVSDFIPNVIRNPRFLYTALSAFSPADTIALFEELGLSLKTERGRRVFPTSDRAVDVVDALKKYAARAELCFSHVKGVAVEDGRAVGVITEKGVTRYDAVILATGGASYPLTGSDGSGYQIVRALGHTVTPLRPSLVPITSPSPICAQMQGLSLKNVSLRICRADGKVLYEDFGEMMFTHFGITGPMVLSASAHLREQSISSLTAVIDLKPALDEATLDARLLSDFSKLSNRNFENALGGLLPAKMIPVVVAASGISAQKKVHTVTREERRRLLRLLKEFSLPLSGFRPIEEAIVTSGGVEVREIDPKTMASKKWRDLYFAGELIDVDAYTGGYNLQIAFSTGFLAGQSAAEAE